MSEEIRVRIATIEDADFLGELMVDSFRSKFEFAVGKDKYVFHLLYFSVSSLKFSTTVLLGCKILQNS